VEHLLAHGLGKGGTLDNAIVVGEKKIHNQVPLRFPDEFVRHKVMDLLGDISLVGRPIRAHIVAVRCGHHHNIAFTRLLKQDLVSPSSAAEVSSEELNLTEEEKRDGVLGRKEIEATIPHRPPFLLVDKVKIIPGEGLKAVGYKQVRASEYYFRGHFPERPIMPGVLIVEAMAQTASVLFMSRPDLGKKFPYFLGIREAKFRKPVFPGHMLRLQIEVTRARIRGGVVRGEAFVGEDLVCETEFLFSIVN